jgi:hypothetical protein
MIILNRIQIQKVRKIKFLGSDWKKRREIRNIQFHLLAYDKYLLTQVNNPVNII